MTGNEAMRTVFVRTRPALHEAEAEAEAEKFGLEATLASIAYNKMNILPYAYRTRTRTRIRKGNLRSPWLLQLHVSYALYYRIIKTVVIVVMIVKTFCHLTSSV